MYDTVPVTIIVINTSKRQLVQLRYLTTLGNCLSKEKAIGVFFSLLFCFPFSSKLNLKFPRKLTINLRLRGESNQITCLMSTKSDPYIIQ